MFDPQNFRKRAVLTRDLRAFFDAEGFVEIDTPLLAAEVCVDAHIDPIRSADGRYLQPSPELAMKRLLCDEAFAAACPAIWQLCKAFRHGEWGKRHHPEFTICEWYRLGDSHIEQMAFTESLVDATCRSSVSTVDPPPRPYPRVTYNDALVAALRERLPQESIPDAVLRFGDATTAIDDVVVSWIAEASSSGGTQLDPATFDREGWLDVAMVELIEPWLLRHAAVFLTDYPMTQSALATTNSGGTSDRFELYLRGDGEMLEVANGYNELLGREENAARMERANMAREKPLDLPAAFLRDAESLPPCSGVALGWDRLVLYVLGKFLLDEVLLSDAETQPP